MFTFIFYIFLLVYFLIFIAYNLVLLFIITVFSWLVDCSVHPQILTKAIWFVRPLGTVEQKPVHDSQTIIFFRQSLQQSVNQSPNVITGFSCVRARDFLGDSGLFMWHMFSYCYSPFWLVFGEFWTFCWYLFRFFVDIWSVLVDIRSVLVDIWWILLIFSQFWLIFGQLWLIFGLFWLIFGQFWLIFS